MPASALSGFTVAASFARGDERALEEAYDVWGPMVYKYACSQLGPGRNAEDVTVRVFVSAWDMRVECHGLSTTMTQWFLGIARLHVEEALRTASSSPNP